MDRESLARRFCAVRTATERLMEPLSAEDFRVQSMPDVSPPYWNLGHTSWFFVANVLRPFWVPFTDFPGFDYAFNSYYEGLGPRLPRAQRGAVAQPTTEQVRAYRAAVDVAMIECILGCPEPRWAALQRTIAIGLEHEQQHQELFLTEILHIRWSAPADQRLPYAQELRHPPTEPQALAAIPFAAATTTLGSDGNGFAWDNELPAHKVLVGNFALGDRLITNAEWLAFVADRGYERPLLWLSNGWNAVQQHGWQAPLYWQCCGRDWRRFTLRGFASLDPQAPVCHVSFYEAEAFARWYGEQIHDLAARAAAARSRMGTRRAHQFRPAWRKPARRRRGALRARRVGGATRGGLRQLAGDAWEWTVSHYEPYPGYRPFPDALMEYNGKFMDNQRVLRGGSFATPRSQARACYRNFWPPDTRFQATGVRLTVDR
jgi:ergothioneine biosynthesis protein EgtB